MRIFDGSHTTQVFPTKTDDSGLSLKPSICFFHSFKQPLPTPMASPPNSPKQALKVTPLNSIPPVHPLASNLNSSSIHQVDNNGSANPAQPSLMYLPSQLTAEETSNVLSVTNNALLLNGSAAMGNVGPPIGKVDIGQDDSYYIFRMYLPGVAKEGFSCETSAGGQIVIQGITTTGEKTVFKDSMTFEMLTQNLCPPGDFSISFKLPGPVDSRKLTAAFNDGVLEGIVMKSRNL